MLAADDALDEAQDILPVLRRRLDETNVVIPPESDSVRRHRPVFAHPHGRDYLKHLNLGSCRLSIDEMDDEAATEPEGSP